MKVKSRVAYLHFNCFQWYSGFCSFREFVLRKAFKQLDKDNSGTLTRQELEDASNNKAGLDISSDKLNQLLAELEKDPK